MKSSTNFSLLLLLCLLFGFNVVLAQDGYWAFKEIIQGNTYGSTLSPDKIELDVNEGTVEFTIHHANNCKERYRFTYRFLKDMNILEIPENSESLSVYPYEVEFIPLDPPCYPDRSYSNPYINVTHAGASSGLKGNMKKTEIWKYKFHEGFLSNQKWYSETGLGGENRHYARKIGNSPIGKVSGYYNVLGPVKPGRLNLYLKNYPSVVTDFRIMFKSQSTISKEEAFYYDILFIYELKPGNAPLALEDPCEIIQPDCSCCPGTIPIWNFKSKKGDCICPEGQVWDKVQNKCVGNP